MRVPDAIALVTSATVTAPLPGASSEVHDSAVASWLHTQRET
jgi:hypothetical protein